MAPFPESESMTIKRLEVAIRKKDMHLLKDGAYKLHEKFHTGHKFEFLSELEQILEYVKTSDIPLEITEILCPTIEEILAGQNGETSAAQMPQMPQDIQTSSAVMQISKTEEKIPEIKEEDIKLQGEAYEEYMAQKEAARELEEPEESLANTAVKEESRGAYGSNTSYTAAPSASVQKEEVHADKPATADDIVLFYDDKSSDIDYSLIKDYRNKLNNLFSLQNHSSDYSLLKDIATLNNIVNTKIFDLNEILSVLKTSKSRVSFVTTSQSSEITKILSQKEIEFEIPFVKDSGSNGFSFIPMLGLSNIFVCSNCNLRSLKGDLSAKTLSVQCPNCDSAAFPDLYAINSYNPDCNPIFWHRAFGAFVKSKVWIIINPPLDENKEIIFDFIKTACECSKPRRIYLFSKENDKREFYKNMFLKTLPDCDLRSNYLNIEQLCEDYIRTQISGKMNEKY